VYLHYIRNGYDPLDDIHFIIMQLSILVLITDKSLSFTVKILKEPALDLPHLPSWHTAKKAIKARENFSAKIICLEFKGI